ncbi:MAG: hypothetical protein DCC88_09965 [Spirobacillus cienkowskii]|jgi:hypothetical protein|uniref:Uncharacterized protein n=1 Tax=Spirobacillus cienkowskii TaxID=495820 RepID=A0A369KLH4_9BACT|nr:MAG: hypothetical protein DCC88_09965 [Spirobacillus cienkowskii]
MTGYFHEKKLLFQNVNFIFKPITNLNDINLSHAKGGVMLNYFSFLNELNFDEKNFSNWSCIFSQVYLLKEISKKISKLKINWERNSFQIFGGRENDLKNIDFSLKNSFVYVKIINQAIFKEKINWKFTKFLAEEIFYLFSDIHFFCLKILSYKNKKNSRIQKAINDLKKEVIEIYNLIFKIFVCYYYNKSKKHQQFDNFFERALEKIYTFEILSNRTRNLKGFKFVTKIKFYYTSPQKN